MLLDSILMPSPLLSCLDSRLQNNGSAGPSIQVHPADSSSSSRNQSSANQTGFAPQDKALPIPAATSQAHASAPIPAVASTTAPTSSQQQHSTGNQSRARDMKQPSSGNHLNVSAAGTSKGAVANEQYQREAERIVAEEREASEKMPYYEGLSERFQLIKKMGDGAFSNVYKARDRQTGQKVAIKVVRKYELNSNQVCTKDKSGFWFRVVLLFSVSCSLSWFLLLRRRLLSFSFPFRILVLVPFPLRVPFKSEQTLHSRALWPLRNALLCFVLFRCVKPADLESSGQGSLAR